MAWDCVMGTSNLSGFSSTLSGGSDLLWFWMGDTLCCCCWSWLFCCNCLCWQQLELQKVETPGAWWHNWGETMEELDIWEEVVVDGRWMNGFKIWGGGGGRASRLIDTKELPCWDRSENWNYLKSKHVHTKLDKVTYTQMKKKNSSLMDSN